jgi:hypothetical protein
MCFGGPSQAEKNLQKEQAAFTATLMADYQTTFAEQQAILQNLNSVLAPIVAAGPNQQGFSAPELSALNTQAIESNARGVNQTEQAAAARENAAGGGTSFLPSGVNAQINAEIGSAAESNLSNEQLGITQANYAQGRQNWQTALAGEAGVASQTNPLGYAGQSTSSNQTAFNEANTINQQSNAEFGNILGAITGIASVAAAPFTGGASLAGGGLLGALSGGGGNATYPSGDNGGGGLYG